MEMMVCVALGIVLAVVILSSLELIVTTLIPWAIVVILLIIAVLFFMNLSAEGAMLLTLLALGCGVVCLRNYVRILAAAEHETFCKKTRFSEIIPAGILHVAPFNDTLTQRRLLYKNSPYQIQVLLKDWITIDGSETVHLAQLKLRRINEAASNKIISTLVKKVRIVCEKK